MIHTVAYESQLKSDRAALHRRLAGAIEERGSVDENAALIAEHAEGAGELAAAFAWHMRAGTWAMNRNIAAAHTSWRRAQQVADRLPADHPDRMPMRIAPRTFLCATASRQGGRSVDPGFEELRQLCAAAGGDQRSVAMGMVGLVTASLMNVRRAEASRLADEQVQLLESIADPSLTLGLLPMAMLAKHETGEMAEILRLAQRLIDLAGDDPGRGNVLFGSPLMYGFSMRGIARASLGIEGWKQDFALALETARDVDVMTRASVVFYTYVSGIAFGLVRADETVLAHTTEAYEAATQAGEDIAVGLTELSHGVALACQEGADRAAVVELMSQVCEGTEHRQAMLTLSPIATCYVARAKIRLGEVEQAIALAGATADDLATAGSIWIVLATTILVEALLTRGTDSDLDEANVAIDRLAAAPTDPGYVVNEIAVLRLRALLAQACGDDGSYRDFRDHYRAMATSLGFEGHIAMAETMH
ncbi:hypothetical protein [Mycobacterium sp.]|uniref:hypothetical protein n=1 Tax=Mycobacterium sp. TaxID=1785 RepID=UPI003C722BC9